jgi:DNA-binding winged helix-turn-helix (wHTH) protein/tetratricopeptide (TPR) repeat protein
MDQLSPFRRPTGAAELAALGPMHLGGATAYPASLELAGAGLRVHLEPRMMQVLLVLGEVPGRTVSRAELLERCWGGLIVDDSALNRVIVQLRRAAAETGCNFSINTVPRVGYRIVVDPVALLGDTETAVIARPAIRRRGLLAAGLVGAVALAGGTTFWIARRPDAAAVEPRELQDRAIMLMRDMTPARDAEAVALLQEATSLDPGNASLFGTLALAQQRLAEMGADAVAPVSEARAREAARSVLALDPANADAQVALALIMPVYRNWLPAERSYERLLARFPDHVPLLAGQAKMLAEVGRFDEAMARMDRLFAIEPLGPAYHWRRALGLWAADRPEAALSLIERARRIWPANRGIWHSEFWLRAYTGQASTALLLLSAPLAESVAPEQRDFMQRSAVALDSRAPGLVEQALVANRRSAASNANMAEQAMAVAGALGEADEVFSLANAYHFDRNGNSANERLEPGERMSSHRRKTLPLFWPPLAGARADPRFGSLTERLALNAYWAASGTLPDFRLKG